jgi:hypothetical protein
MVVTGGFVPKEPLLDGPFYESKYDTVYHSSGTALASGSLGHLPAITKPPSPSNTEHGAIQSHLLT